MSNRDSYTFDEWSLIRSVPAYVTAGVTAADPSGIVGVLQEAFAGANAFRAFGAHHPGVELIEALADDPNFHAMPDLKSLFGHGDPAQQSTHFLDTVIERALEAQRIIQHRGEPGESAIYVQLINSLAENVAHAAVEGGFIGFGGVRVSEKEHSFLVALAAALAAAESPAPVEQTTTTS